VVACGRLAEELEKAGKLHVVREAKRMQNAIFSAAEGKIRVVSLESDEEMKVLRR
jgi:hypothetical protein